MPSKVAIYSPNTRSGKSTVADFFVTKGFQRYSFAMPVKAMLGTLLTLTGYHQKDVYDFLYDKKHIKTLFGVNGRELLVSLGNDWGRGLNSNMWVEVAKRNLPKGNVVIDDLRYPNEYEFLQSEGFKFIKVVRNETSEHNEGRLTDFPFDYTINNSKGLNGLLEVTYGIYLNVINSPDRTRN